MSTQTASSAAEQPRQMGTPTDDASNKGRQFRQALIVWCVFIVLAVLVNGTIPFALGVDLHAWTASPIRSVLLAFVFYAVLFLAVPLLLIKGWQTVRQPAFLLPLVVAMLGVTFWHFFWPGVVVAVGVLAYLHWRFDLSGLGIRSQGLKGDALAVALMGLLGLFPLLMRPVLASPSFGAGVTAALTRLFANPAASIENLFYFGFLTERISCRAGKWLTPLLIGLMYTAHEMSNPEYWYGGMSFGLVFVGIVIWAAIYLWRRNSAAIWLGDGLYRFAMALF